MTTAYPIGAAYQADLRSSSITSCGRVRPSMFSTAVLLSTNISQPAVSWHPCNCIWLSSPMATAYLIEASSARCSMLHSPTLLGSLYHIPQPEKPLPSSGGTPCWLFEEVFSIWRLWFDWIPHTYFRRFPCQILLLDFSGSFWGIFHQNFSQNFTSSFRIFSKLSE